jgi:WD40 repeat protein
LPEDHLGKAICCPLCNEVFTATAAPPTAVQATPVTGPPLREAAGTARRDRASNAAGLPEAGRPRRPNAKRSGVPLWVWLLTGGAVVVAGLLAGAVFLVTQSLTADADDGANWTLFSSPEGQFRVSLPGTPEKKSKVEQTANGPVTVHMLVYEDREADYSVSVSYTDSPAFDPAQPVDAIFDEARQGVLRKVPDGQLRLQARTRDGDCPANDLIIEAPRKVRLRVRHVVAQGRMYELMVTQSGARPSAEAAERFLASFHTERQRVAKGPDVGPPINKPAVPAQQLKDLPEAKGVLRSFPTNGTDFELLAFMQDGKTLFGTSLEPAPFGKRLTPHLWETASGRTLTLRNLPPGKLYKVFAHSPDGRWLLVELAAVPQLQLYDVARGTAVDTPFRATHGGSFTFSPDSKILARTVAEGVRFWDVDRHEEGPPFLKNVSVLAAVFTPDEKGLFTLTTERNGARAATTVKRWDLATRKEEAHYKDLKGEIFHLEVSQDGRYLVGSASGSPIQVVDLKTNRVLPFNWKDRLGLGGVLQFTPDGQGLLVRDSDMRLHLFALPTLEPRPLFGLGTEPPLNVRVFAFSRDGRWLATAGDGTVTIWDAEAALGEAPNP